MRVLFSTLPGLGHFHPMVPMAQALADSGHNVAFAASRSFCPTVETVGFPSFPAGVDWDESEAATTHPLVLLDRPDGQVRFFVSLGSQMADDLVRVADSWFPDAFVREPSEYGAWMAAERLGLPHITLGIMIRTPGFVLNAFARQEFAELLSEQGLPPDPKLDGPFRHLYLDFMPPSFVPEGWPQPPTVHHIRPTPFDRSGNEELPEWTHTLRDRPVVYATLGTVFNQAPQVFACILDALADTDIELIITVGRNGDPQTFGPQPANVHIERYIPQSQLLGLCDVVVSHGGYGTLMAAMTNGLPVCCLPFAADQCFGANRCEELGVGLSLASHVAKEEPFPHMGPGDLVPERLADAVHRLLTEPSFRSAAQVVSHEIAEMRGIDHAVDLMETTVGR